MTKSLQIYLQLRKSYNFFINGKKHVHEIVTKTGRRITITKNHPLFVFGKNVMPGVLGSTPKFGATVTAGDNVPFEFDFRSVYATLLSNWLCVSDTDLQQIMLKNFQTLSNNLVRFFAFDVGNESYAASIMLILRIV